MAGLKARTTGFETSCTQVCAEGPSEALDLLARMTEPVDSVLTMQGMNRKDMALGGSN